MKTAKRMYGWLAALCACAATFSIAQPLTGIRQVEAGGFTCALTYPGGAVKCWGLGYGAVPADVLSK